MIRRRAVGIVVLGLIFLFWLWLFHQILPQSDSLLKKKDFISKEVQVFNYTALGDSLTEGVGDTTDQGGFVSMLANQLQTDYGYQVDYDNFGVAGNTSNQILKRLKTDEKLKASLSQADLMTLTVGGNDVLTVIRKNLTNLTLEDFEQASVKYQKRLREIISLSRQDNPNLPIYILGIYNPFFLSFPELTEMQEVIDNWNIRTQEVVAEFERVYFVEINEIIYQGFEDDTLPENDANSNNVLYEQDRFHPNILGYRLMANAVEEVINDTKNDWLAD